ncbi:high-affinity choline transporter 1-like isoform X2 [Dermacentor albipictus]|uniref:high-affinity choline transporter 1-like isoform X2 n=1 Tax=Dermacentor albipictus TaxID=60249 RepID=UPI0031FDE75F
MAVHNIPAVLAMLLYFLVIVCVGVWSGCKLHVFKEDGQVSTTDMRRRRPHQNRFLHRLFLADRNMSLTLGISSMTATWVGGGYLNGTAEAVYTDGVLYCHAPIGYAISLILGGFFFAQKMRTANAVTMLDPFQEHYGRWMGLLLCLPALCGEVLWTAAVLAALGDTAGAVMEVDSHIFIIIAATTILFYTALGGHYSVVYTDVFQICTTAVFLWVCVPFVLKSRGVGTVSGPQTDWLGHIPMANVGQLLDAFLMTALGGIPWQVYFQCILGCKSDFAAQVLSYVAAIGCVFMALPPMIIGAAAKTTNFTAAGYPGPWQLSDKSSVLPQSIRYLTTPVVSIMGMLGITAAVMSSADSSMFSASAMVTKNVYHVLIRPDVAIWSILPTPVVNCAVFLLRAGVRDGGGRDFANRDLLDRLHGHLPGTVGAFGVRTVDTVLGRGVRAPLPAVRVHLLPQGLQHLWLYHSVRAGCLLALVVRRADRGLDDVDTRATARARAGPAVSFPAGLHGAKPRRARHRLAGVRHGVREALAAAALRRVRLLPRAATRRGFKPTRRQALDQTRSHRVRADHQDRCGERQVGAERALADACREVARDERGRLRDVRQERSQPENDGLEEVGLEETTQV